MRQGNTFRILETISTDAYLTRNDTGASYFSNVIYTQNPAIGRYPPVPNYVGSFFMLTAERIGIPLTSHAIITAFHFATVLFFAILVVTVYELSLLFGLPLPFAVFTAVVTFLYPSLFGHGLSNLKDTAQVSLFTLAMYVCIKGEIKNSFRTIALGGIIWGLGLATKFNAIYVPIIWSVWSIFLFPIRPRRLVTFSMSFLVLLVCGLVTMFIVWPYLWTDPLNRLMSVVRYFTTVGTGYKVFWDGVLYQVGVGNSLWWYPVVSLLLVTPIAISICFVVGILRVLRDAVTRRNRGSLRLVLVIWIVVPLVRALFPSAAFYDGVRHFLEILPPFLILAVIGIQSLSVRVKYPVAAFLCIIFIVHLVYINSLYFPFSSGYYNFLAQNPNVQFDRDIESLSIREAIDYIHTAHGPSTVWAPLGGHLAWYYLTSGDRYVYNAPEADSIILINKSSHFSKQEFELSLPSGYHVEHIIARGNEIFAWIYRKSS